MAAVAYLPPFLSSPGRVSADSKQALLVDPGRFLADAASLWDPGTGAGTVPHQHLGFLWPMGPWFWAFDQLGVPVWIAQRLWLGTLVLVAALGARWLARSVGVGPGPALVAGLVYALTPYQLTFTARMSVLLLPWAGLPWLVELTRRAVRAGGWRHPALFGLVLVTAAGVNATALVLVGLGPLVLLAWMAVGGRWREVLGATVRLVVVSIAVSAWWLAGLVVQGRHGMPVLQLTESLHEIARWSQPAEVLRGLGSWFFAGRDRLGYSLDQAEAFLDTPWGLALSAVVPALALGALVVLRGRVRTLAVVWLLVGVVVAVGAWPLDGPSPYGRAFRWFAEETSAGLALRNSHRVVPLVVLAMALALAVFVDRLPRPSWRTLGTWGVGIAAFVGLAPAAPTGLLSEHLHRPEQLPDHWLDTAALLDERSPDEVGNPRRILELPGAPFAAYRWGNTVEPVLPALVDRPQVAREVLPYGSPATANLLDALDRRLQEGVFERESLAPIARLFAASDVVVRNDLQWERFGIPAPSVVAGDLVDPAPPGITSTTVVGDPAPIEPDRRLAPVGERELAADPGATTEVPPVAVLEVEDADGVIRARPTDRPLVVAGDGEGLVDVAAAGLLAGDGLVHYADALDDDDLDRALDDDAWLVLTDTNRRRIETWFYAIRDVRGPTERAGETLVEPSGYDQRLEVFPGSDDRSRTVVEHVGGTVEATLTGGAARPEDRAIAAFDGDLATAWRVGGPDPTGHRISVRFDGPVDLDEVTLVQPQDGPRDRWIEQVHLRLDGAETLTVDLDERSTGPEGQQVEIEARATHLEIEIARVSTPPFDPGLANAVGFAEIHLSGPVVAETVVLPPALLDRVGPRLIDHGLDVVLTRVRHDPFARGRTDAERHLDRTFELPVSRTFALSGRARINPAAPDRVLDELFGTRIETQSGRALTVSASSRLAGDLGSRASAALDHDPATGWTAAFGPQEGQWFALSADEPVDVGPVTLHWSDDLHHSVPTRLAVEVDGAPWGEVETTAGDGERTATVTLDRPIRELRLTVGAVERRSAPPDDPAPFATLPVSLREVEVGAGAQISMRTSLDTGCRDDLVTVDGAPLPVRVHGPADAAREGLTVEACGPVELSGGRHRLVTEPGWRIGIDLDRLVLSSDPGGAPAGVAPRDRRATTEPPELVEVDAGTTAWTVRLESDGEPFWLILAQSRGDGWEATIDGRPLGTSTLVGGFANGWLVEPDAAGTVVVELRWTPQQLVWWALALSALAVGLCLGFALGSPRVSVQPELTPGDRVPWDELWSLRPSSVDPARLVVAAASATVLMGLVTRPWVALATGVSVVVATLVPVATPGLAVAAPLVFAVALAAERYVVGWLAVGLVVAACAAHLAGRPANRHPDVSRSPADAPPR